MLYQLSYIDSSEASHNLSYIVSFEAVDEGVSATVVMLSWNKLRKK